MEHEKCYVFSADVDRSAKRRRLGGQGLDASRDLQEKTFREHWATREQQIETERESSHRSTAESIVNFVNDAHSHGNESKIPTGLIVTGPSIASSAPFFDYLSTKIKADRGAAYVSLRPEDCPNLKTFLKVLIAKTTTSEDDQQDDEDTISATPKGPRRLNYDLENLYDWTKAGKIHQIVVGLQHAEAFDVSLLAEAIDLLQYAVSMLSLAYTMADADSFWLPRIPFILLFGIGTSVEFFHERLPRTAMRSLQGLKFDVAQADEVLERAFRVAVTGPDVSLWLGASVAELLLDRQREHIQTVQSFVDALKYAYMAHFYANPLSVFNRENFSFTEISKQHFEALRNLSSFRNFTETLLDKDQAKVVRDLLADDLYLLATTSNWIEIGKKALSDLTKATELIWAVRNTVPKMAHVPYSQLYVRAMSANLNGSPLLRDLLLTIRKAPSDLLLNLIDAAESILGLPLASTISEIRREMEDLISASANSGIPLRSDHDVRRETMRTTVVAQRVELSKQKSSLSKEDTQYSGLVEKFHQALTEHFDEYLIDPRAMFLSEILVYDLKSPHRDVFMPRPRQVIERALSSPHDYLSCDCCAASAGHNNEAALSASQPPTAILYQLYLESGTLINATDLFTAFNDILGDKHSERLNMALFQRGLAELRYLGMIKGSRKKTDHVAKVLWKGL